MEFWELKFVCAHTWALYRNLLPGRSGIHISVSYVRTVKGINMHIMSVICMSRVNLPILPADLKAHINIFVHSRFVVLKRRFTE